MEPGNRQDSGSCEALQFNLVDMVTLVSSNAGDEFGIFLSDWSDLILKIALRFRDDDGENIWK